MSNTAEQLQTEAGRPAIRPRLTGKRRTTREGFVPLIVRGFGVFDVQVYNAGTEGNITVQYCVAIDSAALDRLARKAARNKRGKAVAGPLHVTIRRG